MSDASILRLTNWIVTLACVALAAALVWQVIGNVDFNGLPFLWFGIAMTPVAILRFWAAFRE